MLWCWFSKLLYFLIILLHSRGLFFLYLFWLIIVVLSQFFLCFNFQFVLLISFCVFSQMNTVVIPVRMFVRHIERRVGHFQIQIRLTRYANNIKLPHPLSLFIMWDLYFNRLWHNPNKKKSGSNKIVGSPITLSSLLNKLVCSRCSLQQELSYFLCCASFSL